MSTRTNSSSGAWLDPPELGALLVDPVLGIRHVAGPREVDTAVAGECLGELGEREIDEVLAVEAGVEGAPARMFGDQPVELGIAAEQGIAGRAGGGGAVGKGRLQRRVVRRGQPAFGQHVRKRVGGDRPKAESGHGRSMAQRGARVKHLFAQVGGGAGDATISTIDNSSCR